MSDSLLKPSDLKLILRSDGTKCYKWIGLLKDGKLLLEGTINKRKVIGKILSTPSEGELYIWPQLQHENISRLLEVLYVSDKVKILISLYIGNSISTLIYDNNFNKDYNCFDRKKSYAKGILSALSYMHRGCIFHLNLSDENIAVCSYTDKAMLCDFTFAVAQEKVPKRFLPPNRHHQAPEVESVDDDELIDSLAIDIWDCGIVLLQMFTQHQLPWHGAVNDSLEFLEDIGVLKKTNPGANLNEEIVRQFKCFIQHMLSQDPALRPSAAEAMKSYFLQTFHNRFDKRARWKNDRISDKIVEKDRFVDRLSVSEANIDLGDTKSDTAGLTWTKSEPNNKLHPQNLDPDLLGHVGSPALSRNSDENCCDSRKEAQNSYLTNWEVNNPLHGKNDFPYIPYPEILVDKEGELSNYPPCSLEQIIPHIISMSDLYVDDVPLNFRISSFGALKESRQNSVPHVSEVGIDDWFDIPLENKQDDLTVQFKIKEKGAKTKKAKVPKKQPLNVPPENSTMEGFRRPDSPILIDKEDLYKRAETDNKQTRRRENIVPQKRKWWYCLCCGGRTKNTK